VELSVKEVRAGLSGEDKGCKCDGQRFRSHPLPEEAIARYRCIAGFILGVPPLIFLLTASAMQ
jgi:hypothetical protein